MSARRFSENDLKREEIRLRSFTDWPTWSSAHPVLLARDGFYYSGTDDCVTCYSCKSQRSGWQFQEIPREVHRTLNAGCPVVCGTAADNIQIAPPSDTTVAYALLSWLQAGKTTFDITCGYTNFIETIMQNATASRSAMNSVRLSSSVVPDAIQDEVDMQTNDFGGEVLDQPDLRVKEEAYRLETFSNWPQSAPVHPRDLAKAGFYYTNAADRVKCAFCSGLLRNWVQGDDPATEHRTHFPSCSFIRGDPTDNVPMPSASSSHVITASSIDEMSFPERPRHPEFATHLSRVSSFSKWPPNKRQQPHDLAMAGFYFAGFGDNVKCYFCDGGLRNWEPADDPWVEHAKWFPRCVYVTEVKGSDFVNSVQQPASPVRSHGAGRGGISGLFLRGRPASGGGSHHIEPRQVNARMDTSIVQAVLNNGYSRDKVKKVIERRLQTTGDDFTNVSSLMEALFNLEEEEESQSVLSGTPLPCSPRRVAQSSHTAVTKGASGPEDDRTKDAQSLLEENRMLREEMTCKICMDRESNVVFLPCGHLVCCTQCAPAMKNCPICRATIRGSVRTFMS